jgi:AcrR family transcriptional regulator
MFTPFIPRPGFRQRHRVEFQRMSLEPAPARRRTQEERRTATRKAILDAAADRLVEAGLDGVTIAAVAKAAGVSSGAVLHHFDTKLQLILALTQHLSDASKDEVVHSADPDAPIEDRVSDMIDTILTAVFDPFTRAQFELHTAARVDPALAEQLVALNAHNARVYVEDLAIALLQAQVDPVRVQASMELAVCAAVGLSLLSISGGDPAIEERMADSLKAHILAELDRVES